MASTPVPPADDPPANTRPSLSQAEADHAKLQSKSQQIIQQWQIIRQHAYYAEQAEIRNMQLRQELRAARASTVARTPRIESSTSNDSDIVSNVSCPGALPIRNVSLSLEDAKAMPQEGGLDVFQSSKQVASNVIHDTLSGEDNDYFFVDDTRDSSHTSNSTQEHHLNGGRQSPALPPQDLPSISRTANKKADSKKRKRKLTKKER